MHLPSVRSCHEQEAHKWVSMAPSVSDIVINHTWSNSGNAQGPTHAAHVDRHVSEAFTAVGMLQRL